MLLRDILQGLGFNTRVNGESNGKRDGHLLQGAIFLKDMWGSCLRSPYNTACSIWSFKLRLLTLETLMYP